MGAILSPYGVDFETDGNSTAYQRSFGFSLIGGTGYDIVFTNFGHGGYFVRCTGSHWTGSYALFRESYLACDSYAGMSEYNQYDKTSTSMGAWSFSRPANGQLKITKSKASYAGGMGVNITIFCHQDVRFSSITAF